MLDEVSECFRVQKSFTFLNWLNSRRNYEIAINSSELLSSRFLVKIVQKKLFAPSSFYLTTLHMHNKIIPINFLSEWNQLSTKISLFRLIVHTRFFANEQTFDDKNFRKQFIWVYAEHEQKSWLLIKVL